MPAPRPRRLNARTRQGLRTTAVAVAAVAALTASQAPNPAQRHEARPTADDEPAAPAVDIPLAELDPPGDSSYHTELPPLVTPELPPRPAQAERVRAESGIPGTVLRAYRAAERSVARTDPRCALPWELLAAIGKVESGQARGGAVDRHGTTLGRITGPALNGDGFALILDTDGGVHDGDTVYDRAVGPMQFLPSTWAHWGTDGNGDGRADPNNVFDAALAAGHYLCAGDRNLGRAADLDRAILSYNYSESYLRLVRYWLEFYRGGVHPVPDGKGVIPTSPGAGGTTPATRPVDEAPGGGGGGIVVGPDPSPSSGPRPPAPSHTPTTSPTPSPSGGSPDPTPDPSGSPSDSPSPTPDPTDSPDPSPDPSTEPTPDPTTADPTDCATPSPSPTPTPPEGEPTCAPETTPEPEMS
ncbi:lytic transglycosylase domain-containing protein [Streptomyces flavalbus]|uniref:Lytic transglycosylase domain-containing protein n=1 Tax=Streptomyces flavalbus TaxID=2665155 RepID=A0ABW2WGD1_9ACTN